MVRRKRFWGKYLFFIVLLAAFVAGDFVLSVLGPRYYISSGRFWLNDYELVRRDHPEEVWDRVFFGNSVVISAYREDVSESGYINLGVDYGVVTDLWDMVRKGTITVGSDLVIGLNDLTLYDHFDTNPTYPWHRKFYEPYCYFARDRLRTLFEETVRQMFTDFQPAYGAFFGQTKPVYYGSMSTQALYEKETTSQYALLPMEEFAENLSALSKLAAWCRENGVRLRVVWMPMNPDAPVADITLQVREAARALCWTENVEFYDMSDALEGTCFYDAGHLNYEYGAYVFTREVEAWLVS